MGCIVKCTPESDLIEGRGIFLMVERKGVSESSETFIRSSRTPMATRGSNIKRGRQR